MVASSQFLRLTFDRVLAVNQTYVVAIWFRSVLRKPHTRGIYFGTYVDRSGVTRSVRRNLLRDSCAILTFSASFTVFICFDFCTSDLRSSCCLRSSSLYDVFVLRSVDTLLVFIWGLHTMTSLSWLAIRAAIVSLRCNAPKLDAVTKQVISRLGLSRCRGSLQTLRPTEVHSLPNRPRESR